MPDSDLEPLVPYLSSGLRVYLFGLLLVYALVLPIKWAGLMPTHITWLGLALVPAALFALLGSLLAGPLVLGRRWLWLFVLTALVCCFVMFAVIWFERGW